MKIKSIKKIDSKVNPGVENPDRIRIRRSKDRSGSYENVVIASDMDVD